MNQGSGKIKMEQKQVEIVKHMMRCKDYKHACSQTQSNSTPDAASCALQVQDQQKEEHENHIRHDLNYEIKEDHVCIVCGIKNSSFRCKDCQLWIHDECKVLPEKYKHYNHKDHILSLFFLPEEYRIRKLCCDICHKQLQYVFWVYYCLPCRFFVHIKCADKKMTTEESVEYYTKFNMVQLPVANAAVKLTSRFLKQNGLLTIPGPSQIVNFHNDHHLLLLSSKIKADDELVCDGCIEPIVDEYYYSCQQCSYFLHDTCSQLPNGLELSKHPSHDDQLHINHPKYFFSVVKCSECQSETNGWSFECRDQSHQFLLDMKCTFIPTYINHKAHTHPLTRNPNTIKIDSDCNACGKSLSGSTSYCCSDCHFYLGIDCALLPPKIIHNWDEHSLLLMYPPFPKNPDDFLCELCEEYVHPKHWVYHCKKCDQSFHPHCISRLSENRNIKFGGTIEIAKHHLKLVERGKYGSRCECDGCNNKSLDKENALQCTKCDVHICRKCALNNLEDVTTISPCNGIPI
ncbi:uncharacterized protein LOC125806902 [Solanum verrucosum]|uniref:uncharacterized protein LOC125806902 n=1 Tax=Solanum verrucosum TaxID=315347 RepID=UPI0020D0D99A|nr:uncharacterized protein LOC125806902 [Solanum verrucosum]